MRIRQLLVIGVFLTLLGACSAPAPSRPDYQRPLAPGTDALIPLRSGEAAPDFRAQWHQRSDILPALEGSIGWANKPSSRQHFPMAGIGHARNLASLNRFQDLLVNSRSADEFAQALKNEFQVYRSAGWDGRGGGVLFTGYCTPILDGRLQRNAEYSFPLYRLPPDLVKGAAGEILGRETASGLQPYPTRRSIERRDLLANQGLELVWLRDPIDAYIAHVNGSAVVRLGDGSLMRLGYSGKNGRPYSSLRGALERAGEIQPEESGLPALRAWAGREPVDKVLSFLHRNQTYVFFIPIAGTPHGSLNVPVTARRTLATDKTLFPRGALVFVDTQLPSAHGLGKVPFRQFMFDQDTGGAIRTAGRADIYLGVGETAEVQAGSTVAEGQLYYLFLRR
jgi:membrane-bound lytic murein transglycosylase A